jgi:asparagine synthase (glutamine-hydrolysing)
MCGIAGILAGQTGRPPIASELDAMAASLWHRGPDGSGRYIDALIGLAHTRLSIIDIASGHQPLCNEDGTVWVSFNGEIFNYIELRDRLVKAGHQFRTHSDTEVLVHLYEERGDAFVEELNGQFAIALWDLRQRRLVLARDRIGIRPLFYTEADGRLIFASEVKALFALSEVRRRLRVDALAQLFSFWSTLGSDTVFEGVQSLPPGHLLVVEPDGRRVQRKYWDWDFSAAELDSGRSEADWADELHALLVDAVRLQLRADVPVGAYLSGGLDSSIVSALIRKHTDTPLRTFSLTFDDGEFDESAWQQELVDHLGTRHSALRCDSRAIVDAFPRTIWHTEMPVVRTAPTPMMLLAGLVRESGYKVVLTGEGADEVFGGYDLFKEAKIRRFIARDPKSALRSRIVERLYPYLKNSPAAGLAFSQRFFGEGMEEIEEPWFAHATRIRTTQRTLQFLRPELHEQLSRWDARAALRQSLPATLGGWHPMGRDQYVEAHTLMSGYLLSAQGDRMAMASSIEGRFPYLDHRVIEFANRLPPRLKLRGLTEKYLLKASMKGELPEAIRLRTKQPFRAPDSVSFFDKKGRTVDYVDDLLSPERIEATGLFDPAAVGKLVNKCRAGRVIGFGDNMAFVGVLSTMLLHEQFVRPTKFADARIALGVERATAHCI